MLIKNFTKTFLQAKFLTNILKYRFSDVPREYILHPDIKHTAQINVRALRRKFLNESVLNHNKIVLHGDIRKISDKIIPLKNEGKCVGIIRRHISNVNPGEQRDIDIVLPAKQIRGMRKNRCNGLLTVYVRVQDKQYRCILSDIDMHHQGWVQQVGFDQYVPNQPNNLTIPIQITHITENPYFQQGSETEFKQDRIDIICYNEEYPLKFYIDSSFVCPERPYRVGDLSNTFPPGLILAPHTYPNQRIFQILPIPKMQLHMKQKLMKSYLASTKKQKVLGGQAGGAAGTTGTTGTTSTSTDGAKSAPKK